MRKWFLAALLSMAWGTTKAQGSAPLHASDNPMSAIWWLIGDWTAETKTHGPNGPTSEVTSHFRSADAGRTLSISMSEDGVEHLRGSFSFDQSKKVITFSYAMSDKSDPDGAKAAGTVRQLPGYLLLDFTATETSGATGHLQTRIVRLDDTHYRWEVYVDYPNEGLQKLNEIVFGRKV